MQEERISRLDRVAAEFVDEFRGGKAPSIDEYCARYPDLAADLRGIYLAIVRLERARPEEMAETGQARAPGGIPPLEAALGDFRIVREIGHGGMGVVYEAVQESLNRRVALKVLSPWVMRNPRHVQRFEREARAAAQLHHTNIVPVLGVGEHHGVRYLVMQLIHGAALDELLSRLQRRSQPASEQTRSARDTRTIIRGLLTGDFAGDENPSAEPDKSASPTQNGDSHSAADTAQLRHSRSTAAEESLQELRPRSTYWRSVASIGLQAAEALAHAHHQGVLHRDIKPSNLLIDHQGTVWIADFGLAKTADSADLTMSGELVGTIRYLPPERLRGESDARGDTYGLGATLYELSTLRPPFEEADHATLLKRVLDAEPIRPRTIQPSMPRDLETIIVKAMAKSPVDRYESARALASDLRSFLQDVPISARRTSAAERLWRACRRHPAVAIPTAAAVLLLIAMAVGSAIAAARLRQENQLARDAEQLARDAELRAVQAERDRREELFRAHLATAQRVPATGRAGQRLAGLRAINDALQIRGNEAPSRSQMSDLVDAAIPCLTRIDVREISRTPALPGRIEEIDVDSKMEYYTYPLRQGAVIASLRDQAERRDYVGQQSESSTFQGIRSFSRNRRWLVEVVYRSGEDSSTRTRVWEIESGRVVLDLTADEQGLCLDFLPDERHLLIAGGDGALRVFDLQTAQLVRESPSRFRATAVTCSPDGRWLALVNVDEAAEIIDMGTWETIDVMSEVPRVTAIAFRNDGSLMLGTFDGQLYHWRIAQREGNFIPGSRKSRIALIRFSQDGELFASCGDDVTQIRRVDDDVPLLEIEGYALRFSPDGARLAVHKNGRLVVHEIVAQSVLRNVQNRFAEAATFSPDSSQLAVSGLRGAALFATDRWNRSTDFGLDHCGPIAFAPNGSTMVTVGLFTEACAWPIDVDNLLRIGPPRALWHDRPPDYAEDPLAPQYQGRQAVFTRHGRLLVADYRRGRVMLQDTIDKPAREFAHLLNVARLAVSPDGKWLAGAAVLATFVRVWNTHDGTAVFELPFHAAVAFSPDGKWFATRSASEFHLYRVGTWKLEHRIELPASRSQFFLPMTFQPRGNLLAVAGPNQRVYLYNPESGRLLTRLPHADEGVISHLAFSPDGSQLAVVRRETAFSIWNLDRLQLELNDLRLTVDEGNLAPRTASRSPTSWPAQVAVDRGPFSTELWCDCWARLARNEAAENKWSDAIHAINQAINSSDELTPDKIAAYLVQRGTYHLYNLEHGAARDSYTSALQHDRDNGKAAYQLARLFVLGPAKVREPRRVATLLALLEEQGELQDHVPMLRMLADIRLERTTPELISKLEKLPAGNSWRTIGTYFLALAYHSQHDEPKALEALTHARRLHQQTSSSSGDLIQQELTTLAMEVDDQFRNTTKP